MPDSPSRAQAATAAPPVVSPPPTPSRLARYISPGAPLEPFWTVTEAHGCVPAMALAFNGESWWGDPQLPEPLNEYEALALRLPHLCNARSPALGFPAIRDAVDALPPVNLFASRAHVSQRDLERSATPGHEHAASCPNAQPDSRRVVVLASDQHRERAFAALAFIANAFVHSSSASSASSSASRRLPRIIAEPLQRLATAAGRLPATDYASSVLTNWTLEDPHGTISLENVRITRTFTGTDAERWFYAVHVCIEHRGGRAFKAMFDAKEEITRLLMLQKLQLKGKAAMERGAALQNLLAHSTLFSVAAAGESTTVPPVASSGVSNSVEAMRAMAAVCTHLNAVSDALADIWEIMSRLSERCPADIFFDEVRVFLASWPDPGVVYDNGCSEACRQAQPIKLAGASGAQSALLPSMDGFLGVAYTQSEVARTDLGDFVRMLKRFRQSMPPVHRQTVALFESAGNCRELVAAAEEVAYSMPAGDALTEFESQVLLLKAAYNDVLERLVAFRRGHADYATKYIKQMARERHVGDKGKMGTGGSDFATHLQRHIVDTRKAMYALNRLRGPSIHRAESLDRIWGDLRP